MTRTDEPFSEHQEKSKPDEVLVSIIVPAHNSEKTIGETLDSILAQTFSHWEAVIVNDGSTDHTDQIVEGYIQRDARFSMLLQSQGGEAAARNAGLAIASGEWLLFLDSDDWISPVYLERMIGKLKQRPDLDAVLCRSARVAANGTIVPESYQPPAGDLFSVLARRAAFPVHACVVRKSLVDAVGRFDTTLVKSPDWDLWQRIARTGAQFGAVDEVLAFYRMTPHAASLDAPAMLRDGLRVLRQGHAPDPRVKKPHPHHANGRPAEEIPSKEFYLLCWCAGLMIGSGQDPIGLFDAIGSDHFPELYPQAVAQSLFDAVPLPNCLPPEAWQDLYNQVFQRTEQFLSALEKQSQAKDLAHRTMVELKKMILNQSPHWRSVLAEYERNLKEQNQIRLRLEAEKGEAYRVVNETQTHINELDQVRLRLEEEKRQAYVLAEERESTIHEMDQTRLRLETEKKDAYRLAEERESTIRELDQTRLRLEEEKKQAYEFVDQNQSRIADLEQEQEKANDRIQQLEQLANERKAAISELRKTFWVRLGKKLRAIPTSAKSNQDDSSR